MRRRRSAARSSAGFSGEAVGLFPIPSSGYLLMRPVAARCKGGATGGSGHEDSTLARRAPLGGRRLGGGDAPLRSGLRRAHRRRAVSAAGASARASGVGYEEDGAAARGRGGALLPLQEASEGAGRRTERPVLPLQER